ncbi:alpha/beta hydrolase [Leucobacter sp. UT-8R-CII-1-4]|uniref:alpha/beta fold hydrolase n=1 Tax=Leucobacter sp. UT-8R-CII-1-4 TaxID=3040075 RepID=UPI0024A86041|nr:alpha/beta hydrolase [Leucobacter sp. UT-8R-CII-1-4]MDI6022367.1 alpha/beta hydrolase [Leucobacter sp. UT-8R-CII-1-4]
MRKGIKATLITIGSLAGVVALGLVTTTIIEANASKQEATQITDYGTRISTSAGEVNVYQQGAGSQTIVLLPGFGTASPALDFIPLIDELSATYRVIAYEPLGSGLSDDTSAPRTIENYASELHETLEELDITDPVLMGHSIAGIYALNYVNTYPGEVAAFVGIDNSVPGQPGSDEAMDLSSASTLKSLGLLRLLNGGEDPLYATGPYTESEKEQIRLLTNRNSMSQAVVSEAALLPESFATVKDQRFPAEFPVLLFVAPDPTTPIWKDLHAEQISGLDHGELIELPGEHYLHHTQSAQIAAETRSFLSTTN